MHEHEIVYAWWRCADADGYGALASAEGSDTWQQNEKL